MIFVITGNGKGKTTSAIGMAIRGLGWGKKVAVVFFDKGGSHYGEGRVLEKLKGEITVLRFGQQRFDEAAQTFRFSSTDEDRGEAKAGVEKVSEMLHEDYFLLICDELINAMNLGLIGEEEVKTLVDACPKETHLVLTGRNAPAWLIEKADLVSEIKEIKHYYKKMKKAIKGIDF